MRSNYRYPDLSEALALKIRAHSLKMVTHAKASHIGSALSIADIVAVLYAEVLNIDPNNPQWEDRDRFILSKGHACVAVYAALAECNFFPIVWLSTYGTPNSSLINHITHSIPGSEFSTGSLGHGLSFGVGKSLALRNRLMEARVFVLMSDGELDEGSNWEAIMFAGHHRLNNLTAIIDYNNLQSLGKTSETLTLEPLKDKFLSFGWSVLEIDGHSHFALKEALSKESKNAPKVVIARTTKGKGVSFMENKVDWHYRSPSPEQLSQALEEIATANAQYIHR